MFIFNPPMDSPLATEVPCVVYLSQPQSAPRMYGPFASLVEAIDWCSNQSYNGSFQIAPLRRTDKVRNDINDWFGPEHSDIEIFIDDIYDIEKFRQYAEKL